MNKGTVTKWRRYVGDTDQIELSLGGIADPILPGATVSAVAIRKGVSVTIAGASVTDLANFVVAVPMTTWLATASPGVHELRIILDGTTWPDQGRAEVTVVAAPVPTP